MKCEYGCIKNAYEKICVKIVHEMKLNLNSVTFITYTIVQIILHNPYY